MADAKRDGSSVTTLLAVSNGDGLTPVVLWADPVTHRLLTSSSGGSSGLVVGTTTITGGTGTNILYDNSGVVGEYTVSGTGTVVAMATSPTLITPTLGAASATSINKVTITAPASSATLTIANGKTLTASNTLVLAGTDSTTMTFPSTSATIARTDAANTFTGHQTIEGVTSTGATGTGNLVFATSPTVALASASTAVTQSAGDNTTAVATDAFVTTAIANAIAAVNPAMAVQCATTQASDTSSLTYVHVAGIGDTFTGTANTAITIDGHTLVLGDRVLVKNDTQTSPGSVSAGTFNGIYLVTTIQSLGIAPILTRALDYDTPSDINNTGAIPVISGTANANTSWLLTSSIAAVGTGSNALTYVQFSVAPTTIVIGPASATSGAPALFSGTSGKLLQNSTPTGTGNPVLQTSPSLTTPTLGVATATSVNGLIVTTTAGTLTIANNASASLITSGNFALTLTSTAATNSTFPSGTHTLGGLDVAQTWTAQNKFNNIIDVNNAVSVTSNAGTVPVTFRLNTFTNSSAATMAITMATSSAVDGQMTIVRIYDFSAVAQTIGWTNTENSTVSAPLTSNGSTTLPLTVGFQYNSGTSKWRCIASA